MVALTSQWFAYFNPPSFQGPSPGSTLTSLVWSPKQSRFTRNSTERRKNDDFFIKQITLPCLLYLYDLYVDKQK